MAQSGEAQARQAERFGAIEKVAVTRQAVHRIREMVLSHQLKPGDALPSERELAAQLSVSRSSLREAIRALELVNVLETRHGCGTFVTSMEPAILIEPIEFILDIDTSVILHLFEVRKVIETSAAALAAVRITPEELDEIDHLVGQAELSISDPEAFLELDLGIHNAIIQATKNPLLIKVASSIARLSRKSRSRTTLLPTIRAHAHEHHRLLAACLRAGDAAGAGKAMEMHLDCVQQDYRELSREPSLDLAQQRTQPHMATHPPAGDRLRPC
ncbi:MAG: FadR/GntR family transcriptional regulator [Actinomycetota bacterium]|jgi:DNA-binding FadR family transcriptional regulator|nr:FadR/GntR family transcriptional regulator [Actinomycetota bacterium]